MSRYRVQYSPAAYDDLRAIYRYIAFEMMVEETARAQTERIRYAIRASARFHSDIEPWTGSLGHHGECVRCRWIIIVSFIVLMKSVVSLRLFVSFTRAGI